MILGTLGRRLLRLPLRLGRRHRRRHRLRRARRRCCTRRDRDLRRRPHRLRRRDQHHRRSACRRSSPRLRSPACPAAARRSPRRSPTPWEINLPFIADPAEALEDKHWFLVSDLAAVPARSPSNLSVADRHRGCCSSSAPAGCCGARRSGCGCGPAARARRPRSPSGVNVYRYKYRRRARSPAPWPVSAAPSSRMVVSGLTRRPDRRPGLHRPGRDDLRQLAARRAARSAPACSATPRRCSSARRDRRCTRCCCVVASCCSSLARAPAAPGARPRGRRDRRRSAARRSCVVPATDAVPREFTAHGAVRRDAAGARVRLAATAHARGRRAGLPQGRARDDASAPESRTAVDWDALTARARGGDARTPTRRTPTSRSVPPRSSTTVAW